MSTAEQTKAVKSRITVIEHIYHQEFGESPTQVESRYSRDLDNDTQPYTRNLRVGEAWEPLDTGWIAEAGLLIIQNNEGKFPFCNPTEEEREEAKKKILEVCYGFDSDTCWLTLPKESTKLVPSMLKGLNIRSQYGVTKFTIHVYPK